MSISATREFAKVDLGEVARKLKVATESTDSQARFPSEGVKLLGESGLMGLLVPAEQGGMAASADQFVVAVQTISSICASTGMIFVMHCCAVETVARHSTHFLALLKASAEGKHLSTLACSERGTGANFYASFSTSRLSGDDYILDADKCFVTSGEQADSYVVSTRAPGSDDCLSTSIYVVPKDASGLSFHGQWQGLGLRGNSSIALKLEGCRVPSQHLLGKPGAGLEIEMDTILPRFLLGSAAVYNGIAEAAFNATVSHLKERVHAHTGDNLALLPVARSRVAQMKVALDASMALTRQTARSFDAQGAAASLTGLLEAKQLSAKTAISVANASMECCGGTAYAGGLTVERHLRDAQAGVLMAPTNDISLDLIGRAALGLPLM